ncbi:ABC transporter permease [Denitrobaculum tricleocarpae]|uniref:ABC transporter permease n=1 Tax=Denitrobaculum tricleocarpae TaxID=2591009 RepID=A0A545TXR5_9PROT|nr:ABC transporter permease [Denitrobaculum tricleocarpae]TQV82013.1 ABC transporter permease [Denitrobaculum tricleocarpae]
MATAIPPYVGPMGKIWHYSFRFLCGLIFLFLILPILVIIPLSFNAEPYFTFSPGMLAFESTAYSTRWYQDILNNEQWLFSIKNSFIIAFFATFLATGLGTLAALGLSRSNLPGRGAIMGILISPMIVPLIISAAGMYFFYSGVCIPPEWSFGMLEERACLTQSFPGIILAHAALGTPFVVITVTATLVGFDHSLTRASASLGANPTTTFFKIIVPLILPGVISGALFAFITSFDEVVVVLFISGFEQRTVPRQMWAGIREQISPTILAVATMLIIFSVLLMTVLELLRRRNDRLRGVQES